MYMYCTYTRVQAQGSLLLILIYGWVYTATSRHQTNSLFAESELRCTDVLRLLNKSDLFRSRRTANVRRRAIQEGLRTDITPASLDFSIISTHRKADSPELHPVSIPVRMERQKTLMFLPCIPQACSFFSSAICWSESKCRCNNHFDS